MLELHRGVNQIRCVVTLIYAKALQICKEFSDWTNLLQRSFCCVVTISHIHRLLINFPGLLSCSYREKVISDLDLTPISKWDLLLLSVNNKWHCDYVILKWFRFSVRLVWTDSYRLSGHAVVDRWGVYACEPQCGRRSVRSACSRLAHRYGNTRCLLVNNLSPISWRNNFGDIRVFPNLFNWVNLKMTI